MNSKIKIDVLKGTVGAAQDANKKGVGRWLVIGGVAVAAAVGGALYYTGYLASLAAAAVSLPVLAGLAVVAVLVAGLCWFKSKKAPAKVLAPAPVVEAPAVEVENKNEAHNLCGLIITSKGENTAEAGTLEGDAVNQDELDLSDATLTLTEMKAGESQDASNGESAEKKSSHRLRSFKKGALNVLGLRKKHPENSKSEVESNAQAASDVVQGEPSSGLIQVNPAITFSGTSFKRPRSTPVLPESAPDVAEQLKKQASEDTQFKPINQG